MNSWSAARNLRSLEKPEKDKIYDELVKKVCNARFVSVLKSYKDRTIGQQGSNTSDQSLRAKLKGMKSDKADK